MCTSHSHAPFSIQESPSTEEWGKHQQGGALRGRRRRKKEEGEGFPVWTRGNFGCESGKTVSGLGLFWRKECPLFLKNFPMVLVKTKSEIGWLVEKLLGW